MRFLLVWAMATIAAFFARTQLEGCLAFIVISIIKRNSIKILAFSRLSWKSHWWNFWKDGISVIFFRPCLNGWPTSNVIYYYFMNYVFLPKSSRTWLAVGFLSLYNLEMMKVSNLIWPWFSWRFLVRVVNIEIHICMHAHIHTHLELSRGM